MRDVGATPMGDPLAYFLTWTTYGTWLPGDERGWVKEGEGFQLPNWKVEHEARRKLAEEPFFLTAAQRAMVEATIEKHCEIRGWRLFAKAARTAHAHVVVHAPVEPDMVMDQFKTWCTRKLREQAKADGDIAFLERQRVWTEDGSNRRLDDTESLEAAIIYVRNCQ
jgi:hypothetical protein